MNKSFRVSYWISSNQWNSQLYVFTMFVGEITCILFCLFIFFSAKWEFCWKDLSRLLRNLKFNVFPCKTIRNVLKSCILVILPSERISIVKVDFLIQAKCTCLYDFSEENFAGEKWRQFSPVNIFLNTAFYFEALGWNLSSLALLLLLK